MELSAGEQRRWRELAAELKRDRRLAVRAARFDTVIRWRRGMATARAGTAIPAIVWIPAAAGGVLGLALVVTGTLAASVSLIAAGMATIIAMLLLAGVALLAIGTTG